MSVLAYLPRFAATRVVTWWSRGDRFALPSALVIGRLRALLRGDASPIKPKLAAEIVKGRRALVEHMLHELGACCDEASFELAAAARAA